MPRLTSVVEIPFERVSRIFPFLGVEIDVAFQPVDPKGDTGYFIECDLLYPPELHDQHSDLPLCPNHLEITREILSDVSIQLGEKHGQKFKPQKNSHQLSSTNPNTSPIHPIFNSTSSTASSSSAFIVSSRSFRPTIELYFGLPGRINKKLPLSIIENWIQKFYTTVPANTVHNFICLFDLHSVAVLMLKKCVNRKSSRDLLFMMWIILFVKMWIWYKTNLMRSWRYWLQSSFVHFVGYANNTDSNSWILESLYFSRKQIHINCWLSVRYHDGMIQEIGSIAWLTEYLSTHQS